LHSGEEVIACGRNGVSEAEAQAALNEVEAIIREHLNKGLAHGEME
jgi:hypothetical protein